MFASSLFFSVYFVHIHSLIVHQLICLAASGRCVFYDPYLLLAFSLAIRFFKYYLKAYFAGSLSSNFCMFPSLFNPRPFISVVTCDEYWAAERFLEPRGTTAN